MPVFTTNVMAISIAAAVDNDAHDNEDLKIVSLGLAAKAKHQDSYSPQW